MMMTRHLLLTLTRYRLFNGSPKHQLLQDTFSNPTQNWTYVLGICQDVPTDDEVAGTGTNCEATEGSAYEVS